MTGGVIDHLGERVVQLLQRHFDSLGEPRLVDLLERGLLEIGPAGHLDPAQLDTEIGRGLGSTARVCLSGVLDPPVDVSDSPVEGREHRAGQSFATRFRLDSEGGVDTGGSVPGRADLRGLSSRGRSDCATQCTPVMRFDPIRTTQWVVPTLRAAPGRDTPRR